MLLYLPISFTLYFSPEYFIPSLLSSLQCPLSLTLFHWENTIRKELRLTNSYLTLTSLLPSLHSYYGFPSAAMVKLHVLRRLYLPFMYQNSLPFSSQGHGPINYFIIFCSKISIIRLILLKAIQYQFSNFENKKENLSWLWNNFITVLFSVSLKVLPKS